MWMMYDAAAAMPRLWRRTPLQPRYSSSHETLDSISALRHRQLLFEDFDPRPHDPSSRDPLLTSRIWPGSQPPC